MNIKTGLSKSHIKNVVLQTIEKTSKYEFKIKIDGKEYNADLIGFVVQPDPIIRSYRITVKDMNLEDFERLKIQTSKKYKIDDDNYYVSKVKADGFTQKIEFDFYPLNGMIC